MFFMYISPLLPGFLNLICSYESTCTVVGGNCVKPGTATVYVVVGTSGHALEEQAYRPYPW